MYAGCDRPLNRSVIDLHTPAYSGSSVSSTWKRLLFPAAYIGAGRGKRRFHGSQRRAWRWVGEVRWHATVCVDKSMRKHVNIALDRLSRCGDTRSALLHGIARCPLRVYLGMQRFKRLKRLSHNKTLCSVSMSNVFLASRLSSEWF